MSRRPRILTPSNGPSGLHSGQAVDLQEATGEPASAGHDCERSRSGRHADRPGIRVAEYSLVIDRWHPLLWPRGDRQRSEVMLWVTSKDPFKFPGLLRKKGLQLRSYFSGSSTFTTCRCFHCCGSLRPCFSKDFSNWVVSFGCTTAVSRI